MAEDDSRAIEAIFREFEGDGEFILPSVSESPPFVAPAIDYDAFVYTTKPSACISAIGNTLNEIRIGVVGRVGLPTAHELKWLRSVAGTRKVSFLGDMDPVDLSVFFWLRSQAGIESLELAGISDSLISKLNLRQQDRLTTIRCSPHELDCFARLSSLFNRNLGDIGPVCYNMLQQGVKLELELIFGMALPKQSWCAGLTGGRN